MRTTLKHPPTFCNGCPLSKACNKNYTYIPTDVYYDKVDENGKPQVDVLIVGDAPGKNEDNSGMPFTSAAGAELHKALKEAGITGSYAVTHGIKCRPVDPTNPERNRAPTTEELAACSNYIKQDLIQLRPKVVVLLGNTAKDVIAPPEWKGVNISKLKGEILVKDGVTYTATVNPASYLRNDNYLDKQKFYRQIATISRILSGEQTAYSRKGKTTVLKTEEEVFKFLAMLETLPTEFVFVDTETENLNRVAPNKVATIQFALDNDIGFVVPLDHWQTPFDSEALVRIKARLAEVFQNPNLPFECWAAHNSKFDYGKICKMLNIVRIAKPMVDTMMLEYLRDENQVRGSKDEEGGGGGQEGGGGSSFALKAMAKDKLGFHHYKAEMMEARKSGSFINEPLWLDNGKISDFADYAGMDVYVGRRLLCYILEDLDKSGHREKSWNFAIKWGARVTHLLSKIEINGAFVDKNQLEYLRSDESPIIKRMNEIPAEIIDTPEGRKANSLILKKDGKTKGLRPLFGKEPTVFSIDKKDHRVALLVETCGLEPLAYGTEKGEVKSKYAKKGKNGEIDKGNGVPSINNAFFREYKDNYFAHSIQEYEGLKKLKSSYLNSIMNFLTEDVIYTRSGPKSNADNLFDGRVHPTFWDTRTVTGRLASSDPNTQQLPRCLTAGTFLQTEDGIIRIEDIFSQKYNKSTLDGGFITEHYKYENREVFTVKSKRGYSITTTGNHRLRVINRYGAVVDKEVESLTSDDYMLIKLGGLFPIEEVMITHPSKEDFHKGSNLEYNLPKQCNISLARILGYLVSEGHVADRKRFSFTNNNFEIVEDYLKCFELCFGVIPKYTLKERDNCYYVETGSVYLRSFLKNCDLDFILSENQRIPSLILKSPRHIIMNFLAAFAAGDGSIGPDNIRFLTSSDTLACEIQVLLASLGYTSSKLKWKAVKSKKGYTNAVVVEGQDALNLVSEIPIILSGNKEKFNFRKKKYRRQAPKIPYLKEFLRKELQERRIDKETYLGYDDIPYNIGYVPLYESPSKTFSYHDIKEYPNILSVLKIISPDRFDTVKFLIEGNYIALPIQTIKKNSEAVTVYDIETQTHYYVANGISSHNSDNFAKSMIKSMYGSAPGNLMIEADFGQAEIRWWVQIAKDMEFANLLNGMVKILEEFEANPTPELAKRVSNECDIHKQVSSAMNRVPIEEVTKDMRQAAKGLSFGSLFGMSAKSLSVLVKCSEDEAKKLIATFTNKFERAGGWLNYIEDYALEHGNVISPFGRVRHLESLIALNEGAARRVARNSPIQGAASDTTAMAACLIQEWIENNNKPYKLWNVVHDAISMEVPISKEAIVEVMKVMKNYMTKEINTFLKNEFGIDMIVPLVIDFKMGLRWGHCEDVNAATDLDKLVSKLQEQDKRMLNGEKWWRIATEEEIRKLEKERASTDDEKKQQKIDKTIEAHKNSLKSSL